MDEEEDERIDALVDQQLKQVEPSEVPPELAQLIRSRAHARVVAELRWADRVSPILASRTR